MPFTYDIPANPGSFEQGELLGPIWELRPLHPPTEVEEDTQVAVHPIEHPLMIVMTAVCDLEQDFNVRFPDDQAKQGYVHADVEPNHPSLVPHTLLCEAYKEEEIRTRIGGSDIWKRVRQNQDERYHQLAAALVGDPPMRELPDLYLDFRKTLAIPTENLYEGLRSGAIQRIAVVPPVFIHDLMHRFYGYLSRVGLPS